VTAMVPVYLQLPHRPQTRILCGFAPAEVSAREITENFCAEFSRVTINRGERCWIVVVLDA